LKLSYGRIARRADGLEIHAPPLDGVSGATLWAVVEDAGGVVECVLQPAAVQSSFKHDSYVKAEPVAGFFRLLRAPLSLGPDNERCQACAQREYLGSVACRKAI